MLIPARESKSNAKNSDGITLDERCTQLIEWRSALELVGTYTVASSLPGAMIQIAWAMDGLRSLAETLDVCQAGESEPHLSDYVDRIRRLVKSAADVMAADLGDDYEPVRKIVETYAHVGDCGPNWLLNVDSWAEQGNLEIRRRLIPDGQRGPPVRRRVFLASDHRLVFVPRS